MTILFDDGGQPYVDIGRNPPLDDGTRVTLVTQPGWEAGGPVLRYRRYRSNGQLYPQGPDVPIRAAIQNATAILELLQLHQSGDRPVIDMELPLMAERFSAGHSWATTEPDTSSRIIGYLYGAFLPRGNGVTELSDRRLPAAFRVLWPFSDTPVLEPRVRYQGDVLTISFGGAFNFGAFSRRRSLELAVPLWDRGGGDFDHVLPVYRILGDIQVMLAQAARFFRELGLDSGMTVFMRFVNLHGWRLPLDDSRTPTADSWTDPFGGTHLDLGPLFAEDEVDARHETLRVFADRIYNHFGQPRCDLVRDDGVVVDFRGEPIRIQNLPDGEH